MKHQETTHAERVEIVERHLAAETLDAIAESLNLNLFTVRHWWRIYRNDGWAALTPGIKGPPRVGALGRFHPMVKFVGLRLKREHPGWSLPILRLWMRRRPSLQEVTLPKNTALWSYLHQFGPRLLAPRRLFTKRPETKPRLSRPAEKAPIVQCRSRTLLVRPQPGRRLSSSVGVATPSR